MRELKKVTKAEFEEFLLQYPRKLDRNVYFVYEPPLVTYNDITLGEWPESVVAGHNAGMENFSVLDGTK